MNLALLSSKKMDYCTPQTFFEKLDAMILEKIGCKKESE